MYQVLKIIKPDDKVLKPKKRQQHNPCHKYLFKKIPSQLLLYKLYPPF